MTITDINEYRARKELLEQTELESHINMEIVRRIQEDCEKQFYSNEMMYNRYDKNSFEYEIFEEHCEYLAIIKR